MDDATNVGQRDLLRVRKVWKRWFVRASVELGTKLLFCLQVVSAAMHLEANKKRIHCSQAG